MHSNRCTSYPSTLASSGGYRTGQKRQATPYCTSPATTYCGSITPLVPHVVLWAFTNQWPKMRTSHAESCCVSSSASYKLVYSVRRSRETYPPTCARPDTNNKAHTQRVPVGSLEVQATAGPRIPWPDAQPVDPGSHLPITPSTAAGTSRVLVTVCVACAAIRDWSSSVHPDLLSP